MSSATPMNYVKNDKGEFICPHCGENKGTNRSTMHYHMRKHMGEYSHVCPIAGCGKGFLQKQGLTTHLKLKHSDTVNTEVDTIACPCGHTTTSKGNMVVHVARKHGDGWIPKVTGTGACTCKKCEKAFSSPTAYYYHAVRCFEPTADARPYITAVITA